ncbi:unconventional myosin-XIX-like isoform X2 [Stylophora pistillata]|uniref:unconventional myosin-XIX-like isoform X2 n=1 Tax=Stylophora pistillata TaxID=50429 RepID=UPI000C040D1C|nr:unconventional myosin-XIX-like isoform X2 [Stylophora pistillata]
MKVLDNVTANKPSVRRKDGSFEEPFKKKHLEENLAVQSTTGDLTSLSPLNEETVLQEIEARFQEGTYYSWAGVPLIAVNPFQNVAGLYASETVENYKRIESSKIKECPPHIFAVGQKAYCDLKRDMEVKNQSIIVSGESGAGKTWTTRKLMHFITDLSNSRKEEIAKVNRIEQRILDSNPILEAFGNAETVRNENSSRFGKYIQLQFDRNQKIVGATINTYLLEKTRVVYQAKGERKFHIFEQMTSAECDLQDSPSRNDESTSTALKATKQALKNIGIDHQLQCEIFKILSGILKLCQDVHFEDQSKTSEICNVHYDQVSEVCDLLGTEVQSLKQCLSARRITTGSTGEQFMKPCSASECMERRDCVAKLVYSRLFDWIVNFINGSIRALPDSKHSFIGLLDIYGFENFQLNSLEQLCINYANEKLQQHFVYHFMKKQQEEYQKEGVDWTFQEFVDNRPCLNLIEGRTSVFSLMNEECRLKRELDTNSFSTRLTTTLAQNSHFTCPRFKSENHLFRIHHFAESVSYQVEGLVKKNKDFVPPEVIELLQSSSNSLVQELFQARDVISDKADKQEDGRVPFKESSKHRQSTITVVHKFKVSLDSLMSTLRSTNVHYIRCIKPNPICQPGVFDRNQVLAQLNACGLVETIRISAAGYPIRLSHHEFLKRYNIAFKHMEPVKTFHVTSPRKAESASPRVPAVERLKRRSRRRHRNSYDHTRHICRSILEIVQVDIDEGKENIRASDSRGVKVGRTKVFLQEEMMERLEQVRNRCLTKSVLIIQKCWRRHKRRLEQRRMTAAVFIQSAWRGWRAKMNFRRIQEAIRVIQRRVRRHFEVKHLKQEGRSILNSNSDISTQDFDPRSFLKAGSALKAESICASPSSPSFSLLETPSRLSGFASSLASCGMSSWFDEFTPQNNWLSPSKSQMTINSSRGHLSPLGLLMGFGWGNSQTRVQFAAVGKRFAIQLVNKSSTIISRRDIEKVPVAFRCKGTPLAYANTRPHPGTTTNAGLASIGEMDY